MTDTSTSFRDLKWTKRLEGMGDIAERAFEKNAPPGWVRTGFNRPSFDTTKVHRTLMYMPDYFDGETFFEVQGCGRDQLFKFKLEKLVALSNWESFSKHDVHLWLYDSTNMRYTSVPLAALLQLPYTDDTFPEGKRYRAIETSVFNFKMAKP